MGWQKWLLIAAAGACVWVLVVIALPSKAAGKSDSSDYVTTGVYTTAHPTAVAAVWDFLDFHPESGAAHCLYAQSSSCQWNAMHGLPRGRG